MTQEWVGALHDLVQRLDALAVGTGAAVTSAVPALLASEVADPATLTEAWMAEGRSKVVTLLEHGSREALREGGLSVTETRMLHTIPPPVDAIWDEWSRLQLLAAARRGPSIRDRTFRSFDGKAEEVLVRLAVAGGETTRVQLAGALYEPHQETSGLSHVLRDLEDCGLISRQRDGRNVVVELTAEGRTHVQDRLADVVDAAEQAATAAERPSTRPSNDVAADSLESEGAADDHDRPFLRILIDHLDSREAHPSIKERTDP